MRHQSLFLRRVPAEAFLFPARSVPSEFKAALISYDAAAPDANTDTAMLPQL
jgi:hypothetical protein